MGQNFANGWVKIGDSEHLDPETLSMDISPSLKVKSLLVSGTRLLAQGKWFFSKNHYLGIGIFRKNLSFDLKFEYTELGLDFDLHGSLIANGLNLAWGKIWRLKFGGILDILWIGLDIPLATDVKIKGGNENFSINFRDEYLEQEEFTEAWIQQIKTIPLPSVLLCSIAYKFI